MPLTPFQRALLAELAAAPTEDRYLAGGAAMHFAPNSARYSDDLDFFHDSEARVAAAFAADRERLQRAGYAVDVELSLPGFVRAAVRRDADATRVDWAHDSAWRFMPLVRDPLGGLLLHPVDLAVNKVLALAGRDEPRDFVDILFVHARVLPLAALCWAAVGKDPGFTPLSLLELLKRHGRYRPEDFARLNLTGPFDLVAAKQTWLAALAEAEAFAHARPPDESGCLYYATTTGGFVVPSTHGSLGEQGIVVHFGALYGVLPRITDERVEADGESPRNRG
ncbi:MAG TPA: nucleotidyl transferase AbiEii/AbiGii toxin family protein [Gemmatimonadales bacterium]|nr:nucleotidyl transferase AbiEii/AbiGii toxin family protein [Gemmatimonadales bacterium]